MKHALVLDACPVSLQELLSKEESRGRFTLDDIDRAIHILGFGEGGTLQIPYDSTVSDEFIENAWTHVVKESWKTCSEQTQKEADESLRILAQIRSSKYLMNRYEHARKNMMNPSKAYQALEVPEDVDEAMLLTIYSMRVGFRTIPF